MPLRKKGEGKKIENYRGVTLLNSMYKIYAMVVKKRLEIKIEKRRCCQIVRQGLEKVGGHWITYM